MEEEGPPPTRWEVELEFVQGLANPMYVHFLAQQKYFEDPNFVRYIEYLDYWRQPPHVKYIAYPNCLLMLTMLKQPLFRLEIAKFEVAKMLMDGFYNKWQQIDQNPSATGPYDTENGHGQNDNLQQDGNPDMN